MKVHYVKVIYEQFFVTGVQTVRIMISLLHKPTVNNFSMKNRKICCMCTKYRPMTQPHYLKVEVQVHRLT